MFTEKIIVKATGEREPFHPNKLFNSLVNSGASEQSARTVMNEMEREIKDGMTTAEIYSHAFSLLREQSAHVIARYSLKRAVMALGPSGFPFEKYVAEIMRAHGYEAVTDQIVQGACVEHEIDVVAWKGDQLIMIEAKFHHEVGLKSDVKVALYIKSRFDDLRHGGPYTFGGKQFKFGEGWLVTNTKFSEQAKRYAECQQLKLIGWSYPMRGNLEDLISEAKLHPLTCLSTLSMTEKQNLLSKGMVLCKQVVENKNNLASFGVKESEIGAIMNEAAMVCGIS
jgi:hypothetical protein